MGPELILERVAIAGSSVMVGNRIRSAVNERRALQTARHRRATESDETTSERSTLSVVVDTARLWVVAVWTRLVGGAVWAVTAFYVGVMLGAAGVPVVETARAAVATLPVAVPVGSGTAPFLATLGFPLGVLWTLRWGADSKPHRRRLIALTLLVVLPVVLSAVESATVGASNALLSQPVVVPEEPSRAFFHVSATLVIAYGAAHLWYRMRSEPSRSRWSTYY